MSLRPEIFPYGGPLQRLTASVADLARQVKNLQVSGSALPVTRGKFTATFAASTLTTSTITVPSAIDVAGVASAGLVGLVGIVCFVVNNANGTATITAATSNGAAVTGSTTVFYALWPM